MRRTEPRVLYRLIAPPASWIRVSNARRRRVAAALVPFLFPVGALLLWAASLSSVNLRAMNDFGLISVLPPAFYAAVLVLTCGFCLALRDRQPQGRVVLLQVVTLILMLYGTPALVEQTPRVAVTWRHLGLTDFVLHTGTVLPRFDAYFNWPGFFAMSALFTQATGLPSLVDFVAWANVLFNLLYLAPLVLLYRSATRDGRTVWLGVWLFYLANWVGQDYFSPQGFAFFPYLVILAGLLYWFRGAVSHRFSLAPAIAWARVRAPGLLVRAEGEGDAVSNDVPALGPWQRVGLVAAMIVTFAAIVPSHQLTPFAALLAVGALVLFNRVTQRGLPILFAVIVLAWTSFMAVAYFAGHFESLISTVGAVNQNVEVGVVSRLRGSPDHDIVVRARLVMTAVVVLLAFAGGVRRFVAGRRDLSLALLAVAPTPLLLAQYGGEMFLRVYFYMLPALAFFAAALFFPGLERSMMRRAVAPAGAATGRLRWLARRRRMLSATLRSIVPDGSTAWSAIAVGLASLVLVGGFLLTRYGNERMDYFTPQEVQAARFLYQVAPPGSLLLAPGISVPWQFEGYTSYRTEWLGNKVIESADVPALEQVMASDRTDSYFFVTRSSEATLELYSGLSPDVLPRFEQAIEDSGRFQLIYQNRDARIYQFVGTRPRAGRK